MPSQGKGQRSEPATYMRFTDCLREKEIGLHISAAVEVNISHLCWLTKAG